MGTRYTLYEVLEMLIERTSWTAEQVKLDCLDTIRVAREGNSLGVLTQMLACNHPDDERTFSTDRYGRTVATLCGLCGRKMQL